MSVFVVDASVAAKWYLSEPHSEEAIGLLDDEHLLVAPDLLFLEVGSALWKRVRGAEIAPDEALEWLAELSRVPLLVDRKSSRALTDAGFGEHVMWVGDLAA